jgi:hypothetical protein
MRHTIVRKNGNIIRWGFKSKNQLSLFMIWEEEWSNNEVIFAWVLFNSRDVIGI